MKAIRNLVTLVLCLSITACGGGGNTDSDTAATNPRIINGTEVSQLDAPQYVKVFTRDALGNLGGCTGTVIGGHAVLTATHCIIDSVSTGIQAGPDYAPVNNVQQIFVAEGFVADPTVGVFNDLAVLITELPVGRPALGLLASRSALSGETAMIVGFGVADIEEPTFGTLRTGNVTVSEVNFNHIVTQFDGSESNPCFGDSGGPIIFFNRDGLGNVISAGVGGIVSFGTDPNCAEGDTVFYTNVEPYIASILSIVPDASLS